MFLLLFLSIICTISLVITITNSLFWPQVNDSTYEGVGEVSVLIPARNEEKNIAACLETVVRQGAVVAEILVYDDFSIDNTSQIVKEYTVQCPKITLIDAIALPIGWCGKNFACSRLASVARGKWLLFLDADSRLAPNAINRMLAEAQTRQVTFLSCWPKIEMQSLSEKILMPLLNFVVFSIYPSILSLISHRQFLYNPKLGLAHGACMFFERDSYVSFGGHDKVKDQIFEDTRIAQLWRASGRKGICLDGQNIISLRMYTSFKEIWLGFQKNIFPAFTKEYNFWVFILLHFFGYLSPFIGILLFPGLLSYYICIVVILIRAALLLRFRQSFLSLLTHPVGEIVLLLLGLSSWWCCKIGKGVVWKGREYQKNA